MGKSGMILSVGNMYLDTNFFEVETNGSEKLSVGREYVASSYELRLGGSSVNFATQLKKLGLQVGVLGRVGNDENGKKLLRMLKDEGINTNFVKALDGVQTNMAVGVLLKSTDDNIQIASGGANQSLSTSDFDFTNPAYSLVNSVYFGGSMKQLNLWPDYPIIFAKLKSKNFKVFFDHGRIPVNATRDWISVVPKCLSSVEVYLPNEEELVRVSGINDVVKAAEKMFSYGPKVIVVKMGKKGAYLKSKYESFYSEGFKVKSRNTVGAGDAFNAGFVYKYLLGEKLIQCVKFANALAAIRVSANKQPRVNEINRFLRLG